MLVFSWYSENVKSSNYSNEEKGKAADFQMSIAFLFCSLAYVRKRDHENMDHFREGLSYGYYVL